MREYFQGVLSRNWFNNQQTLGWENIDDSILKLFIEIRKGDWGISNSVSFLIWKIQSNEL